MTTSQEILETVLPQLERASGIKTLDELAMVSKVNLDHYSAREENLAAALECALDLLNDDEAERMVLRELLGSP